MKITKSQIQQLIKEEYQKVMEKITLENRLKAINEEIAALAGTSEVTSEETQAEEAEVELSEEAMGELEALFAEIGKTLDNKIEAATEEAPATEEPMEMEPVSMDSVETTDEPMEASEESSEEATEEMSADDEEKEEEMMEVAHPEGCQCEPCANKVAMNESASTSTSLISESYKARIQALSGIVK